MQRISTGASVEIMISRLETNGTSSSSQAQAKLKTVMHNKDNNYITIMWDMPVNTDRAVTPNRLDIVVKDLS